MSEEIVRLHGLIIKFEVQGFWGMASYLRNVLHEMIETQKELQ